MSYLDLPARPMLFANTLAQLRASMSVSEYAALGAIGGCFVFCAETSCIYLWVPASMAADDAGVSAVKPTIVGGGSPGRWLIWQRALVGSNGTNFVGASTGSPAFSTTTHGSEFNNGAIRHRNVQSVSLDAGGSPFTDVDPGGDWPDYTTLTINNTGGPISIYSLKPGYEGQRLTVRTLVGGNDVTLKRDDGAHGTVGWRFADVDCVIRGRNGVVLEYSNQNWFPLSP